MVFVVDVVGVEQVFYVDWQGEVVVLFFDGFYQCFVFVGVVGVQFEQVVVIVVQFCFEGFVMGVVFGEQCVLGFVFVVVEQWQQVWVEFVLQGVVGGVGIEEGVQCLVILLEQVLLGVVFQVWYV